MRSFQNTWLFVAERTRMSSNSPPHWLQVWLSILVGAVGVYAALWVAAKVFRVGLLMHGKPPNFTTLVRWIRMA